MASSVTITLDRDRALRLDINALADADEAAGKQVMDFLTGTSTGFNSIRALLWAGLKQDDPRLTLKRTGELIQQFLEDGGELTTLVTKLWEALAASKLAGGKPEKNGVPEGSKDSAPSGSGSTT